MFKIIIQSHITEREGVQFIGQIVSENRYLWKEYPPPEAGIDGTLEMRNLSYRIGGNAPVVLVVVQPRSRESVEFAAAAGCLKHSIVGDFSLVSLDEVQQLVATGESRKVQR